MKRNSSIMKSDLIGRSCSNIEDVSHSFKHYFFNIQLILRHFFWKKILHQCINKYVKPLLFYLNFKLTIMIESKSSIAFTYVVNSELPMRSRYIITWLCVRIYQPVALTIKYISLPIKHIISIIIKYKTEYQIVSKFHKRLSNCHNGVNCKKSVTHVNHSLRP